MGFWQDKVYPVLPVTLQHAAISAYGLVWSQRRYGGIFNSEYKGFRDRESYDENRWLTYQTIRLRKLLIHAFNTVSYYRDAFRSVGLNLPKLERFELSDLSKIPCLEKETLRKLGATVLISSRKEPGGRFFSSSGSSGTPTQILYSAAFHQRISAAYEARVRNWAKVDRFMPRAMIGGRRVLPGGTARAPYGRYNYFEKQLYLSAYHIAPYSAHDYLKQINAFSPNYLVGYAMSHFILARFFDDLGLRPPEMKAILTSSEKLTPEMRKLFGKVYGCKTYDGWSGVENCGLISETESGELLVSPDVGIVEVLDSKGIPVRPGEVGEVVCTGLLNFDQPLIRYRIGDSVQLRSNQTSKCGRIMPVIDEILGRSEDVIIGKDGREMVRFHGIFLDLQTVKKGQLVQENSEELLVRVEVDGRLSEHDKTLMTSRLISQLGDVRVIFEEMDRIPLTAAGKFKAVISSVGRGRNLGV
jgi:phenylacetate-CoA ligase